MFSSSQISAFPQSANRLSDCTTGCTTYYMMHFRWIQLTCCTAECMKTTLYYRLQILLEIYLDMYTCKQNVDYTSNGYTNRLILYRLYYTLKRAKTLTKLKRNIPTARYHIKYCSTDCKQHRLLQTVIQTLQTRQYYIRCVKLPQTVLHTVPQTTVWTTH